MGKGTSWKDLSTEQRKRRLAWTQGTGVLEVFGARGTPLVDPETKRLAEAIRQRVRAQRVAEGRL